MPGTYSQMLFHIVFSTKGRLPWIKDDVAERLYPFIGGIVRDEGCVLLDAGGVEDHLHLYVRGRTDVSMADLLRNIKSRSSQWIHVTFEQLGVFAWQEGYAVFTVSKSQEPAVRRYIANQKEHHKTRDFKSELLELLNRHGVEFDPRYVFD